MTKMNRAAVALAGLSAAVLPIIAEPSASAAVTGVTTDCQYYVAGGLPCPIYVNTSGADALTPVTVSINGTVLGTATPTSHGAGQGQAQLFWNPPQAGEYVATATQGTSTSSLTFVICAEPSSGWGGTASTTCTENAGSVNGGGWTSLPAALLYPLSAAL